MKKRFNKIYIEITNYCNLNCSFCSNDVLPKKEMSVEEFDIVLNKIKNYTDSIYLHVKGEPLLHRNLDKILSICEDNKIKVNITTNGTLLKKKLDILKKHQIRQINVSLHCENNDPDYFKNVFSSCDELCEKMTIIYRIWTLPTMHLDKISTNIVEKIINYYKLDKDVIDKILHDKNIKIGNNLYIDKDYEFDWPVVNEEVSEIGTCLGTKTHIGILSNGTVVPCCLDCDGIINLGNIFNDNLEDILKRDLFKMINNGFKNRKVICDLCKSCTYRKRFK